MEAREVGLSLPEVDERRVKSVGSVDSFSGSDELAVGAGIGEKRSGEERAEGRVQNEAEVEFGFGVPNAESSDRLVNPVLHNIPVCRPGQLQNGEIYQFVRV